MLKSFLIISILAISSSAFADHKGATGVPKCADETIRLDKGTSGGSDGVPLDNGTDGHGHGKPL